MGFSFKVDHVKQTIHVIWDGTFNLQQINQELDAMYHHPEYRSSYKGIADVSKALFLLNVDDLKANHEFIASHENCPTGPWAVVCAEPQQTAYAMLYERMEGGSHATKVFSTCEAAEEWLSFFM